MNERNYSQRYIQGSSGVRAQGISLRETTSEMHHWIHKPGGGRPASGATAV